MSYEKEVKHLARICKAKDKLIHHATHGSKEEKAEAVTQLARAVFKYNKYLKET